MSAALVTADITAPSVSYHLVAPMLVVLGAALVLFGVRSLTTKNPVVDLRALGNRIFALGWGLGAATVGVAGVMLISFYYVSPNVGANFAWMSTGMTHHACATAFTATMRSSHGRTARPGTPPHATS